MESFDAISLVVISLGAFLLPLVGSRLKVPSIVLEIAFGIIVGPVLHLVSPSEFISGLAVLGFLLLMFLSGFEIELETFREKGIKTLALPIVVYISTVAVSFLIITELKYPIFLALVLCTTSVDIVISVLRSDDTIKSNYGQMLFIIALLADILTLLAATVYASVVKSNGFSISNLNIILYFAIVIFLLRILRRLAWWNPQLFSRMFDGNDPEELGIRSSLALMLALVGVAVLFDIEAILGAFLAGTLFAFVFPNRVS
ncbi:MAG: cation:proton antiporter [Candidatus Actinomarina sp.]|nr:cation:proton antiporter [Candidatus Actinomarina sp.]